jgi:ABC-2 type transport system permease protein
MTLFMREIRGNMKSFVIWTVCIIVAMAAFMAMYPSFASQGEALDNMLKGFSPDLTRMFGFDMLDFTKAMDYFAYVFQYILLAVLIQFMITGAGLISREEDSGTINFLYAKPLSRTSIVVTKFSAGLFFALVFFVAHTLSVYAAIAAVAPSAADPGLVMLFGLALFLGQIMMLGIGMILSMFVTRARAVMSASIGVVLGFYLLDMFVSIKEELEPLKYATPFQYFDSQAMLRSRSIELECIILPVGVAAACLALSLLIYNRRDMKC